MEIHPVLLLQLLTFAPGRAGHVAKCEYLLGDRGYDSTALIEKLEGKGIVPVINMPVEDYLREWLE